ncbi:MAG: hypothetical protein U9P14_05590 [Gemmatimonadota bacterium]|nr:hypothetical protein [Gemmatimonadota bacterium]
MYKKMLISVGLTVLLAGFFLLTGDNRRKLQQVFFKSSPCAGAVAAGLGKPVVRPGGGASLEELLKDLAEGELAGSLDRVSDSLERIELRLDKYRGLLLEVREQVRAGELRMLHARSDTEAGMPYFSAVRSLTGLENTARELEARIDTIRAWLSAAGAVGKQAGIPPSHSASARPWTAVIRWLVPTLVPVQQACLSCHRPLGSDEDIRVLLLTADSAETYPAEMLRHPPGRFGCTVCHHGGARHLDFARAHGQDRSGRPFLPGRLALTSCGLCHSSQAAPDAAERPLVHPWPANCLACHSSSRLDSTGLDSCRTVIDDFVSEEPRVREWLLAHWCEKCGIGPEREKFERTLRRLVVREGGEAGADTSAGPIPGGGERELGFRCPSCGRLFQVLAQVDKPVCPVDGTLLEPVKDKQER